MRPCAKAGTNVKKCPGHGHACGGGASRAPASMLTRCASANVCAASLVTPIEYSSGPFRLKLAERELWRDDALLPVNRLVFDSIAYLIEHRARAVGRDELVSAVWGRVDVADVHLNQAVARARRALGDDAQSQHMIRTVHGFGYRWVGEVRLIEPEAAVVETAPVEPASIAPVLPAAVPDVQAAAVIEPAHAVASAPADAVVAPRTRRPPWLAVAAAVVIVIVGALLFLRTPDAPPTPASNPPIADVGPGIAVVVLPLQVDAPDESRWVALGAMDLIAARLRRAALPVPQSETVVSALHGAASPPGLDDVARIRRTLGAGVVVQGTARLADARWTVSLSADNPGGVQQQAEAADADAIQAARAAADLLLAAMGHAPPRDLAGNDVADDRLQQVQAAMLTSQLDLARSLLGDMPDDPRTATEVQYRLAEVEFRAGRLDEAAEAIAALLDDPRIHDDPLRHGRVLLLRGNILFRRSNFAAAGKDFDAAIALLTPLSSPLDLADALTRRGVIRSSLEDFDGASSDFSQARLFAEQAGDRLRVAHAEAGFGMLQIGRKRLDLALPFFEAAIAQYEAFGVVDRVIALRSVLIDLYANLLRWPEVRVLDAQQWALLPQAGDQGLAVVMVSRRVRLLIADGKYNEAATTLAEAFERYAGVQRGALRYLYDAQADLAWNEGRHADVVAAVDRALETWPRNPGFDRYAYLLLLRQRAALALGQSPPDPDAAGAPAADDEVSAVYRVVQAEWAAQRDDGAAAAARFAEAMKVAEDAGTPALVALVAQAQADWLLAQGQADKAAELAGRVAVWALQDYDCALLRVKVLHAIGREDTWRVALVQAQALAGERVIPVGLTVAPVSR
jgi:DNA-binding winged helix-turn-helix (wHTH) protein/tetratricopeptide (TPR) repeat protein